MPALAALAAAGCGSPDICERRPAECETGGAEPAPEEPDDELGLPAIAELPDPFLFQDGSRVESAADWPARREELKELVQRYEYGHLPAPPDAVEVERGPVEADEESGTTRLALDIAVEAEGRRSAFTARIELPAGEGPFPAFVSPGFPPDRRPRFFERGYALVDFSPNDVAADAATRVGSFYELYPEGDTGVLMAWAWGFHRVIDALAEVDEIDGERIAVNGHSRYGKAALIAGAFDERVALTVPSSSGLAGVGNYRFLYGASETIDGIVAYAPFWFAPDFDQFVGRVERLPFDQHSVMAVIAPRPQLATMGTEDFGVNPQGTQYSHQAAALAYEFLGARESIGIYYRGGSHGLTEIDVTVMLDFADARLRGEVVSTRFDRLPYPEEPAAIPWSAPPSE